MIFARCSGWLTAQVKRLQIHFLKAGRQTPRSCYCTAAVFDAAWISFRTNIPVLAEQHRVFTPDWPGLRSQRSLATVVAS